MNTGISQKRLEQPMSIGYRPITTSTLSQETLSNRGLNLVPARESACRDIACSQTGSCRSSGMGRKKSQRSQAC